MARNRMVVILRVLVLLPCSEFAHGAVVSVEQLIRRKRLIGCGFALALLSPTTPLAQQSNQLQVAPDSHLAIIYIIREEITRLTGKRNVFLDKTPIAALPRTSYAIHRVEPGWHLMWGDVAPEWFEFKAGRTYVLRIRPGRDLWALDGPRRAGQLIAALKLSQIVPTDESRKTLEGKLKNYAKARKKAGDPAKGDTRIAIEDSEYKVKLAPMTSMFEFGLGRRGGTLVVTDTELSYKSKNHELLIPISNIHRTSLAGVEKDWLAIQYEVAGSSQIAYFGKLYRSGDQNRVMLAIQNWMHRRESFKTGVQERVTESADRHEAPFEWDHGFASPGTSLSVDVLRTTNDPPNGVVWISLKASGFSDTPAALTLWQKTAGQFYKRSAGILADGRVEFVPGVDAMMLGGYLRGQSFDVALVDEATNRRAHAKITPFPITAQGEGGCKASAEVVTESALVWLIALDGYDDGEQVRITSVTRQQTLTHHTTASGTGKIAFPILYPKGSKGNAKVTAEGSLRCKVSLDFAIGRSAYEAN